MQPHCLQLKNKYLVGWECEGYLERVLNEFENLSDAKDMFGRYKSALTEKEAEHGDYVLLKMEQIR